MGYGLIKFKLYYMSDPTKTHHFHVYYFCITLLSLYVKTLIISMSKYFDNIQAEPESNSFIKNCLLTNLNSNPKLLSMGFEPIL